MRILLIEDDEIVSRYLKRALELHRYSIEVAADGQTGWDLAAAFDYDLILLDLVLPKVNGISLCLQLRQANAQHPNRHTPVLMMTAADSQTNRVAGLDAGADDYIVKPFDLDELLARIRALLRRSYVQRSPQLTWGNLQLDPALYQVSYGAQLLSLQPKEYGLLELFLRHPEQVFSHAALAENLWTLEKLPTENTLRAHIKGLRKQLKAAGVEDCIETVYGLGYRLKPPPSLSCQAPAALPVATTASAVGITPSELVIADLWKEEQPDYHRRLTIIDEVVTAWQCDQLTSKLLQKAQREAHTLKGSLGLFGLDGATDLAGQIETCLSLGVSQLQPPAELMELVQKLRLAIEKNSVTELSAVLKPSMSSAIATSSATPQLVVLDDDQQFLNHLGRTLISSGFRVVTLSQPQDLWPTLEQVKPNLLMLDILMPEVSGIALCYKIRRQLQWQNLPIFIISADTHEATIQQVFAAGADDYVSKPIRPVEMIARINRRLEQARC
ncbi:MAG: response regulator [Leptolyngbyaceae cyanobacterium]